MQRVILDDALMTFCHTRANGIQAAVRETETRQSLDDSSAPLLQHDDREHQYSSAGDVQFDLE